MKESKMILQNITNVAWFEKGLGKSILSEKGQTKEQKNQALVTRLKLVFVEPVDP